MAELADAPDLGSGVYDVQVQVLLSAVAGMAELADAPDLGSGVYDVQVQVLLSAVKYQNP